MPWMIAVQVQIREMDGATTGEGGMGLGQNGDIMFGQTPFPMGHKTEYPIQRFAETIADPRSHTIMP
jgi:hypothetical protein